MDPPDLRFIVKKTIVKYLACSSDISRDYVVMLEYFRAWGQGVFGDEILSQIMEDFPSELTDELLITLAPPHLKHLKLTNCSGLSCSGLNKAIAKCQQLQALDFSECIHLLHPTVFCCIREKATHLMSLSLENSEVVSDDIVQVALMCCPSLKHLNLSSCKSITDSAFELSNTKNSASTTGSDNHISQPGRSLTSVDISGCQTLSHVAVKHLVSLSGANLTSVNLAWTRISCIALLYLAGLDMEKMARMMHLTDCAGLSSEKDANNASSSFNQDKQDNANQDFTTEDFPDPSTIKEFAFMDPENSYVYNESPLNEMEVSSLKDVLPDICDASFLQSEEILDLQESVESTDMQCFEEFASDADSVPTCSLLSDKTLSDTTSEQENLYDEHVQLLETDKETCLTYADSCGDNVKKDVQSQKTLCWNVSTEDEHLKDSRTSNNSLCNTDVHVLPSVQEESSTSGLETVTTTNKLLDDDKSPVTLTAVQKTYEELEVEEIYDDGFDIESHPVGEAEDRFVNSCAAMTSSVKNECDNSLLHEPCTVDIATGPDYLTMPIENVEESAYQHLSVSFETAKCVESDGDPVIASRSAKCEKSVFSSEYSVELHEHIIDEEVEFEKSRKHHKDEPCKEADCHDNFPSVACAVSENNESSNCSSIQKEKAFDCPVTKSCWEEKDVLISDSRQEDEPLSHLVMCSDIEATKDTNMQHCASPRVTDLLTAQAFQPQITSLDITNMHYQSKSLGEACLKIFCHANKCLKNFAISWSELDDRMLIYLLKNEAEMQCLSLVDCEKLSNFSLSSIPIHCPKLNTFDLKGMCYVTDHGLLPLTRSSHLQSLSLAEAPITDCTLESIAKGCGAKLNVLDISWCEDVTDRGMSIMANSCRSLHHLGLRQCAASKHTLNTLAESCHLISSLNIAGMDNLTDTVLCSLAEGMPLLTEIDASWNSSLSDKGIGALLRCCNKLKKVVLCGLKLITSKPFLGIIGDLGRWLLLEELWRHNRRFQSRIPAGKLALKSCNSDKAKSLGDDIPSRSMSYAPSLRHLVLEYSDKVNDDHLAAIVAVCRGTLFVKDYYGQPVEPKWVFR